MQDIFSYTNHKLFPYLYLYNYIYISKTLKDMELCVKVIFKKTRGMFGKHMSTGVSKEFNCIVNWTFNDLKLKFLKESEQKKN